MDKTRIGLALTGSYCTFEKTFAALEELREKYDIIPIMSENASGVDTRFGKADDHIRRLEELCAHKVLRSFVDTEPIGPKDMLDVLVVAPCTGNTLGKLAHGITDTSVTMACKSQLRVGKPVVLAISTNDALFGSAGSTGALLPRKNIYFVPFRQDAPETKPFSMVSDFTMLGDAVDAALEHRQLQPVVLG